MPYKDINKRREARMKSYYKNREKELLKQKEYDKIRNKTEYRKEYLKEWKEENNFSVKISRWKNMGVILKDNEDWESIYVYYLSLNKCEECNSTFKNSLDKHLDHCHETGFIRNVLCRSCNLLRG